MTVTPVYVVDTSYLCELFAIPHYSTKKDSVEVRRRFAEAVKAEARLYVSLPAIFELAGHIADVADGGLRRKLSEKLRDTVVSSIRENLPWNLLPASGRPLLQPSELRETQWQKGRFESA